MQMLKYILTVLLYVHTHLLKVLCDGRRPMLCIVDEGPQLLRSTDGTGDWR